jgi:hypothetical protein
LEGITPYWLTIVEEAEKEKLLKLAKGFAQAGDLALAFEKAKTGIQASSYEGKSKTKAFSRQLSACPEFKINLKPIDCSEI